MLAFFFKARDTGERPPATEVSDHWHVPQFSKVYDPRDRKTRVAMLITSPEPLFDLEALDLNTQINVLAAEIDRIAHSKWTNQEAASAAALFPVQPSTGFVAILEHASNGAYATQAQRIKAYYAFDGKHIGAKQTLGRIMDGVDADICLTL
ncbi:hypothetical protein [Celeribacter sp. PS-C1]|uniref:hypothetical protein n=1 Tax=Celeribacter sp. PS-C1 TaxID=2820813 RepID=UPI001CA47B35|nr:hypothetical protein [Celeribacter sp. PS-C1]MBW6416860.1 hypothetical protein [Celeribacter sp. PS-C1]